MELKERVFHLKQFSIHSRLSVLCCISFSHLQLIICAYVFKDKLKHLISNVFIKRWEGRSSHFHYLFPCIYILSIIHRAHSYCGHILVLFIFFFVILSWSGEFSLKIHILYTFVIHFYIHNVTILLNSVNFIIMNLILMHSVFYLFCQNATFLFFHTFFIAFYLYFSSSFLCNFLCFFL